MKTTHNFKSESGNASATAIVTVSISIAVAILAFLLWIGLPKGPSLENVAHLRSPQIVHRPSVKVMEIRAQGAPNDIARHAFGLLMNTYFRMKNVPKGGSDFKSPRARWPVNIDSAQTEWIGHYALPVPEYVKTLPDIRNKSPLKVELTEWEYGDIAEILHVGPYNNEKGTVEQLRKFIDTSGYEIAGFHEEEYLRGPGLIFAGKPETYLTIIRYPVKKKK